jgi:hypothetical protein
VLQRSLGKLDERVQLYYLCLWTDRDGKDIYDGRKRRRKGSANKMGVIPRTFRQIFDTIRNAGEGMEYLVRVSMIELYNEKIK